MSFDFNFTKEKLAGCISNPRISDWYDTLVRILPAYAINTQPRVAAWLAQTGHESGDFRSLVENLNYRAQALVATWPRHFPTMDIANQYHRMPERIANRAYANRMGNGPESSGDGWKYRGRGLIQVTGKTNYTNCSLALYGDTTLVNQPEFLESMDGAVRSACWYWNSRDLNLDADRLNIDTISRKVNGGTKGLEDRQARYQRCMRVL